MDMWTVMCDKYPKILFEMTLVDQFKQYANTANEKLRQLPYVNDIEAAIKIQPVCFASVGGIVASLLLFIVLGMGIVSNLIGFGYPAYASFKAIESSSKGDDTQWLTYWVVFAWFNIMETFVDMILFWIPFYYAVKIAFLVWCFLPSTRGAVFLYNTVIKPAMIKQEAAIDALGKSAEKLTKGE